MDRIDFLRCLGGVGAVAALPLSLGGVFGPVGGVSDLDVLEWDYDCSCETSKRLREIGCRPRCVGTPAGHFTGLFYPEISKVIKFSPHSFNPFINTGG